MVAKILKPKEKVKPPLDTHVMVFDRPFAVEYCSSEDLDDKVGECVYYEQRIRVSNVLPLRTEQQIVMHEIIHAADDIMGTGLKENQVQGMALAITNILRSNPHLIEYLKQAERK